MNFGFAPFLYASTNETAWNMFGFFVVGGPLESLPEFLWRLYI
jgi:hypothetical protein